LLSGLDRKKLHVLPLNQRSPNGNTASNFWRKFPFFSQNEFAKLSPIVGRVLPLVYLLATILMILYKSVANSGEIYLNLSGDTRQCCYRTNNEYKKMKKKNLNFLKNILRRNNLQNKSE
jgi:hypothetical protein